MDSSNDEKLKSLLAQYHGARWRQKQHYLVAQSARREDKNYYYGKEREEADHAVYLRSLLLERGVEPDKKP